MRSLYHRATILGMTKSIWLIVILIPLINSIVTALVPLFIAPAIDAVNSGTITVSGIAIVVTIFLLQTVCASAQVYILSRATYSWEKRLHERATAHAMALPMDTFLRRPRGEFISYVTTDTPLAASVLDKGIAKIMGSSTMFGLATLGMFVTDSFLAIVTFSFIAVGLIVAGAGTRGLDKKSLEVQRSLSDLTVAFDRSLDSLTLLRAYNANSYSTRIIQERLARVYSSRKKLISREALVQPVGSVLLQLALIGTIGFGIYRTTEGSLTIGQLVAFLMYLMLLINPFMQFVGGITEIRKAEAAILRLIGLLTENLERDHLAPMPVIVPSELPSDLPLLEFDEASFRYPDETGGITIGPLSFAIQRGEMLAIMGASGSGKSTLIKLIERFYDLDSGSIKWQGVDSRHFDHRTYRDNISYIEQDSDLLGGTLGENLLFGEPYSTDLACELMHRFKLPFSSEDLDREIGDGGNPLSGGEKQRLAWVRALLRKKELLLLDEPTASVDASAEQSLVQTLRELGNEVSVILITHNLDVAIQCDRILVMADGKLESVGTYSHLLKESPTFRGLAATFADRSAYGG